jgi:hypothetical protein
MHLPLTFASFALLTSGIVVLRLFWQRIPTQVHGFIIALACAALLLLAFSLATKWTLYPNSLDAALYWSALAGYEFFLILFTLLSPRWLTSMIAAILIVPLLSATIFLPLAHLFDTDPYQTVPLGDRFVSVRTPWRIEATDGSGVDLKIYWRPSWIPFLQRRVQSVRYYNSQCDTEASFAVLQPDHKSVLMSCPARADQQPSTARSLVVKFH